MSDALKVFSLVAMVVGFFVFHTWIRTESLTTGYELGSIQKRVRVLDSQKHALIIKKNQLLSPENLENWAQLLSKDSKAIGNPANSQLFYLKVKAKDLNVTHTN